MKTNEDQEDMSKLRTRMGIATQRRLIKDLRSLETIVRRHERFFIDMVEQKVPVRFANAKKARYKQILKAIDAVIVHINEEGKLF